MNLSGKHEEILGRFMDMVPQIDFNSAVKVLQKNNWDIEVALMKYFESANKSIISKIPEPVSSIANTVYSGFGSLISTFSNDSSSGKSKNPKHSASSKSSFEAFIESSSLPNFPVFYPMDKSAINSFVILPKKKGLVYLHPRSQGPHFLRQSLCDPRVAEIIEKNFVFFADFEDSDQAKSIKNQFLNGVNFVFAVFSHDGILGLIEACGGVNEIIEFLRLKAQDEVENFQRFEFGARVEPDINEEVWNGGNFDYGFDGFERHFGNQEQVDEELMRAIEESKKISEVRYQNIHYVNAEEDDLRLAIELSKFSQQEEAKSNSFVKPSNPSPILGYNQNESFEKGDYNIISDRNLRKQQDLEMESAERIYREEIKRKEEDEKANLDKIRIKSRDMEEKLKILGDEPVKSQKICLIKFTLPSGENLHRRFLLNADYQLLYYFIESKGLENFDIMTGFPGQIISSGTLESNGFELGGVCRIKIRD